MKVKVILSAITMMVGIAGFGFFQSYEAHDKQLISEPNLNGDDQAKILSATLQIEISVPVVKTMSGSEFISRICYQDAGSLILHSPLEGVEQPQTVIAGDPHQVRAGDVVLVAQREGPERKEALQP